MNEFVRMVLALLAGGGTAYVFWQSEDVKLTAIRYVAVALTVGTATIHLLAGPGQPWLFLNGMGFLALLLAVYFLPWASLYPVALWSLVGYTLLTIALYFVVHPGGMLNGRFDALGLFTKVLEVALVVTLGFDWSQTRRMLKRESGPVL